MDMQALVADLNTNVATLTTEVKAWRSSNDEAHTRFAETLKDHGEQLKTLDNSIRGDGGAGLNERMNRAERFMGSANKLKWLFVGGTITVIGTGIVTLIVAFVT